MSDKESRAALHDYAIRLVKERLAAAKEEDEPLIEAVRTVEFLDGAINTFTLHLKDLEPVMDGSADGIIDQLEVSLEMLKKSRTVLIDFIKRETERIAPNLTGIAGHLLTARLIFAAGGICNLSKMPSSTIQVLGAKRSLFRHLKKGTPPPKHGIIFQHPIVNTAPRKKRGKIARILASKLAIAARIDYYSDGGRKVDLKKDLDERIEGVRGRR